MRHKPNPSPNPELIDEDNPEWTEADFACAQSGNEVLSSSLMKKLGSKSLIPLDSELVLPDCH